MEQARKYKNRTDESVNELKQQAAELIIGTRKILSAKIDVSKDDKIIEEAVKSIE